jgi:hypothetical protein
MDISFFSVSHVWKWKILEIIEFNSTELLCEPNFRSFLILFLLHVVLSTFPGSDYEQFQIVSFVK